MLTLRRNIGAFFVSVVGVALRGGSDRPLQPGHGFARDGPKPLADHLAAPVAQNAVSLRVARGRLAEVLDSCPESPHVELCVSGTNRASARLPLCLSPRTWITHRSPPPYSPTQMVGKKKTSCHMRQDDILM